MFDEPEAGIDLWSFNNLIDVFRKNYEEAVAIMMTVHKGQRAVVGVYSYDIAMTKAARAVKIAREQGYPFRVEVES